jgi:hypothetical protein
MTAADNDLRLYYKGESPYTNISAIAKKYNTTKSIMYKRAASLKLTRESRHVPWGVQELAILEFYSGKTLNYIRKKLRAKGYSRTCGAINSKFSNLNTSNVLDFEYLTRETVAHIMGVSSSSVQRWIALKKLNAKTREQLSLAGCKNEFMITEKELGKFIVENRYRLDFSNIPDMGYIIGILAENKYKI